MQHDPGALDRAAELVCRNPDECAVLLDFDGTLSHVAERPGDATALPEAVEAISKLIPVVRRVALISGRPVADLRSRIEIDGLLYSGLYGLEHAVGSGEIAIDPEAASWMPEVAMVTDAAEQWADSVADEMGGLVVEGKGLSVTLHYRMAGDHALAFEAVSEWARSEAARTGMRVIFGKLNVELIPPIDSDKGTAVEELLVEIGSCLYIGDDTGDLPAFDAIRRWGGEAVLLAVNSGELPPDVAESADALVDGPGEVAALLAEVASRLQSG